MALLLRRHGITRVRPLEGGLEGWRDHGLPLENLNPSATASILPAVSDSGVTQASGL